MSQNVKTILIAMDGSEFSKYALQFYVDNLHSTGDRIILVYCVDMSNAVKTQMLFTSPFVVNLEKTPISTMLKEEEEKTNKMLEEFAKLLREAKLQGNVKSIHSTKPGEGIVTMAKDEGATCIIIGSRGLGTIRRTILGSVSDYVIHHADVPVFVCPPQATKS